MTSRTKRRLAVLALALGLIAAAPYGFHTIADRHVDKHLGDTLPWGVGLTARAIDYDNFRQVFVWAGSDVVGFETLNAKSTLYFGRTGSMGIPYWNVDVPHESITLRVACAVVLVGVWGLVACGRLFAQRLLTKRTTRK